MRPDPFFSGPGLDRADALRHRPDEIDRLREGATALRWVDGAPALDAGGRLVWDAVRGDEALFLGIDGERARFSAIPDAVGSGDARARFALLGELDGGDAPVFAAALSLASWHVRHRFCPNCGHGSEPNRGGWSRGCPACGAEHYPRVDPVVIMLAEHDGRVLLGRQPQYPPGRYSALAGFVEPGETIEAAVARELAEEAGIEAVDVRYVASQPWPFPSSLMIGAWARSVGDALTVDHNELDDARWFDRAEVEAALAGDGPFEPPPRFAIARSLLEHWLDA
ncbi:NAD(+) diphosphatase [Sphingomonas sp. ASV193]|uniref:NAD(+) diphosphatase n=1 Tax=Sphingomonas sp. ASV193 TaxID=3144405 RepID=UPI0032E85C4E